MIIRISLQPKIKKLMCTKQKYAALLAVAVVIMSTGCVAHRGSSSLDNVTKTSTSSTKKSGAPTVRADQTVSAAALAKRNEAREAQQNAVSEAEARAKATAEEVQLKLAEAKKKAEEDAARAKAEAEELAKKANEEAARLKAEADKRAKEEAAKAKAEAEALAKKASEEAARLKAEAEKKAKESVVKVTVREEKATLVESKAANAGQYHVIVGSFKSLDNARKAADTAISQGYLPSVMENAEGMYRVSLFTSDEEDVARQKLVNILEKHPEYVGIWLLKVK
ncbi:MAG: SPOR domain-containing protein [Bacteroidales bacterium]|nr:SPOR domain-containing protein [Bacteroidales bacterium]